MESKIESKIKPFFEFLTPLLEFLTPAVGNRRELQRLKEKSMLAFPSGIVGNCEAESKIEFKIQFSTQFSTPFLIPFSVHLPLLQVEACPNRPKNFEKSFQKLSMC